MRGLLLKDFFVITKQLKIFLIAIPVMALVGGASMSLLAVFLGAVLPMTAIAYDERSKWDELAAMMPYKKGNLVTSKYFIGYFCMLGAAVLVVLGRVIGNIFNGAVLAGDFNVLLIVVCVGLIFIAINTPILFRFGSEKGRFVFILAMALVGACGPILRSVDSDILEKALNISPFLLICIAVILNCVSVIISINIRAKDD